ncbi:lysylphosphatidylglycerol synthase domain-containing protein [Stutzerimonas nitrititolerans]|uniref:lysylphosphatidylglycerol synthase domain-containing protein n=1 Tax=Stutzerimonas nitrititolerans TaxID=2482751 RepID=UPI00289FABCD|nr:lysylphosphatidylglycerol synthase domain-containing protein [Stutzerimonas nitrititolerans]
MIGANLLKQLKRCLLWLGLAFCILTLWRSQGLSTKSHEPFGLLQFVYIAILLLLIWLLAVSSWRAYLQAYALAETSWRTAIRQLGLLLMGKYIPGGIFGFVMRIYDQPKTQRQKLLLASIADQCTGLGTTILFGGALFLTATSRNWLWATLALSLPALSSIGVNLLQYCVRLTPWASRLTPISEKPRNGHLRLAATFQLGQATAWAGLTTLLAIHLYNLDIYTAVGVAGAYLLAVGTGMLIIFLPGGIGAREASLAALAATWIDLPQALYLGALMRILTSLVDVLAGTCSMAVNTGRWRRCPPS